MRRLDCIGIVLTATVAVAAGCGGEDSTTSGTSATGSGASGGNGQGGTGGSGGTPDLSLQGMSCPATGCPAPLECLTYCGFAGCGGNGGFSTCEIPCDPAAPMCPPGQTCFSIADGPGNVCQPS